MEKFVRQWQKLGTEDPYWAVLTAPGKRDGKWEKDEFYATGEAEIASIMERLNTLGLAPNAGRALDFGCGVGRLSRALAARFAKVVAVDISEPMLAEARAAIGHECGNIEFVHNTRGDLHVLPSASFDFVYSSLVLQHIPRRHQLDYMRDFCRVLTPGGVLVFQTPSRPALSHWQGYAHLLVPTPLLNAIRRVRDGHSGVMEMHWVPRARVETKLRAEGMQLLERERHDSAGRGFVSYRYFARKLGATVQ
jgi:SAM-dependent methyltransferase